MFRSTLKFLFISASMLVFSSAIHAQATDTKPPLWTELYKCYMLFGECYAPVQMGDLSVIDQKADSLSILSERVMNTIPAFCSSPEMTKAVEQVRARTTTLSASVKSKSPKEDILKRCDELNDALLTVSKIYSTGGKAH